MTNQEAKSKTALESKVDISAREFHAKITHKTAAGDGHLLVEGWASTANIDRQEEIIEPEAFKGGIDAFMANPILLKDHGWSIDHAIGKVLEMIVKPEGFWIKAMISNADDVKDIRTKIQEGVINAFSIGFRALTWNIVEEIRHYIEIELYEVSMVAIPANREALFSVAKGMRYGTDLVIPQNEAEKEFARKADLEAAVKSALEVAGKQPDGDPIEVSAQTVKPDAPTDDSTPYKRLTATLDEIERESKLDQLTNNMNELKGTTSHG